MDKPVAEQKMGVIQWASQSFGFEAGKVMNILKATCFAQGRNEDPPSDAEVGALLAVARQYNLNPFTRQIYAFKGQRGGIVPIVGIDGWSGIINQHPQFDGIEFSFKEGGPGDLESCTCTIFRKDRNHPTVIEEFFSECRRDTGPWKSHPRRMLRHKALMQAARVAFGFGGIYDEDEGQVVAVDGVVVPGIDVAAPQPASRTTGLADELTRKAETQRRERPDVSDVDLSTGEVIVNGAAVRSKVADSATQDELQVALNLIMKMTAGVERTAIMQEWNAKVMELAASQPRPGGGAGGHVAGSASAPVGAPEKPKGKKAAKETPPPPPASRPAAPATPFDTKPEKAKASDEIVQGIIDSMINATALDGLDDVADAARAYVFTTDQLGRMNETYLSKQTSLENLGEVEGG